MSVMMTTSSLMVCSFGMIPCSFIATPSNVMAQTGVGSIQDITPVNIPTFGMCQSLMNPTVASATAASLGILTPMPCVPVITNPWTCMSTVLVQGKPIVDSSAFCLCTWGGKINFTMPSQTTVMTI